MLQFQPVLSELDGGVFTLKRRIKSGIEGWKLFFTPRLALERVWLNTPGLQRTSNVDPDNDRKPRACYLVLLAAKKQINK